MLLTLSSSSCLFTFMLLCRSYSRQDYLATHIAGALSCSTRTSTTTSNFVPPRIPSLTVAASLSSQLTLFLYVPRLGKHSDLKSWTCKICGKEYKWRSSLAHHQKSAHKVDAAHPPTTPPHPRMTSQQPPPPPTQPVSSSSTRRGQGSTSASSSGRLRKPGGGSSSSRRR
jgi:hypothetical protein